MPWAIMGILPTLRHLPFFAEGFPTVSHLVRAGFPSINQDWAGKFRSVREFVCFLLGSFFAPMAEVLRFWRGPSTLIHDLSAEISPADRHVRNFISSDVSSVCRFFDVFH